MQGFLRIANPNDVTQYSATNLKKRIGRIFFHRLANKADWLPHRSRSNRFYCRGPCFLVGSGPADRLSNGKQVLGVLAIVASLF